MYAPFEMCKSREKMAYAKLDLESTNGLGSKFQRRGPRSLTWYWSVGGVVKEINITDISLLLVGRSFRTVKFCFCMRLTNCLVRIIQRKSQESQVLSILEDSLKLWIPLSGKRLKLLRSALEGVHE